ncbi:hypothetical protein [Aureimonas ureilytica]|uniref:hypothetical protein n=1 Tax=Aureimonas ureilytica TaxID=401562 RepID=UPI000367A124|nr:hypothetical protein [Aureimonas ureilytica]
MIAGIDDAMGYLTDGGLGEVFGLADIYRQMGEPKVQLDSDMAMALCVLANEGLEARKTKLAVE